MVSKLFNSGKELLVKKQKNILSATAVMMILIGFAKLAGFWRIHLLARFFGTPRDLDIYWAASTIPDILYSVFIVGSLNSALVPTLSARLVKKGEKSLWKLFNWIFNLMIVGFIVAGVIALIFAHPIAKFMIDIGATSSTKPFTAAEISTMANLMRLLMIAPLLMGVASIYSALLNVYDRFVVPSLAPLFYNLTIIAGLLVFVKWFDLGVVGLSISIIFGALAQVLIQFPLIRYLKVPYKVEINLKSKDLRQVIKLALPRIIGVAGDQIAVFFDRMIGLGLEIGSLSAFNYALTLYNVPVQLFGATIGRSSNPSLSRDYAKGNMRGFKKTLREAFQLAFFFSIPLAMMLIVLRVPLVRILLGAGEFDWQATLTTSWVLAFLGVGVLGQIVIPIAARAFYSMQNTVTPVKISIVGSTINILGAIGLTNFFSHYDGPNFFSIFDNGFDGALILDYMTHRGDGVFAVGGLGLGMSIAVLIWAWMLLTSLNKRIHFMDAKNFWKPLLIKIVIGLVSGGTMYLSFKILDAQGWPIFDSTRGIGVASILAVSTGLGSVVYLALAKIFDVKEMRMVVKMFKSAFEKFSNA